MNLQTKQAALIYQEYTLSGKVQGVFFRKSAKEMADKLGIKGFIKNMPDGSVYIEAEGEAYEMDEFYKWCLRGPANAHVENIDITGGHSKGHTSFEIKQ